MSERDEVIDERDEDDAWTCFRCGEEQSEGPGALCLPCFDDDGDL